MPCILMPDSFVSYWCKCGATEGTCTMSVLQELRASVDSQYAATLQMLEGALSACCADFQADQYTQASQAMHCACLLTVQSHWALCMPCITHDHDSAAAAALESCA